MYRDRKLDLEIMKDNQLDGLIQWYRNKTQKSSWLLGVSPLALAACGGGGGDISSNTSLNDDLNDITTSYDEGMQDDHIADIDQENNQNDIGVMPDEDQGINEPSLVTYNSAGVQPAGNLKLIQTDAVRIPNRSSGEAHGAFDVNNDGLIEFILFKSSTRDGTLPIDNQAIILTKQIDGQFLEHFTIGQHNGWPITVADQLFKVENGPVVSSWVQDVVVADFNGDGVDDMFFSGHGREYAEGFEGDFGELVSNNDFLANYPGDHIQILFGGETPEVTLVTAERAFWHSARTGDLDNDGDIDIVATRFSDTNVYWNSGSGVFTKSMGPSEIHYAGVGPEYYNASALDVADVTGDGQVDLIIGPQPKSFFDFDLHPNGISIFSYDIAGQTWIKSGEIAFPSFSSHTGLTVEVRDYISVDKINTGDFDGDGDVDIIVKLQTLDQDFLSSSTNILGKDTGGYFGTVVYENLGDGQFDIIHFEPQGYSHPGDGAEFLDFDGDGLLDIVSPGWPGIGNDIADIFDQVFINNGDRTFTQLVDKYDVQLSVKESQFFGEVPGENYTIQYWGIDYLEDEPVLYVNKYGEWKGENDLIFIDIAVM